MLCVKLVAWWMGFWSSCPAELLNDGDLIMLVGRILKQRSKDTVRVTEVEEHADELVGQVRELDRLGSNAAEAADFGRRWVDHAVVDARRNLSGVCRRWCLVIVELHRFFIAISRAVVNHDDREGTAPDPHVWSDGALPESCRSACSAQLCYAACSSFHLDLWLGRFSTACCCC